MPPSFVRDKSLYISHVKDGTNVDDTFMMEEQNMELQAAVMDLTAEDKAGIEDQKRQYHWDKRHKKYVQLGAHETVKAGKRVRTESGKVRPSMDRTRIFQNQVLVHGFPASLLPLITILLQNIDFSKATKTRGLYQKWVKATHQRVAATGSHEEPAADKSLGNR